MHCSTLSMEPSDEEQQLLPKGSSESMIGHFGPPHNFLPIKWRAESNARPRGYRIGLLEGAPLARRVQSAAQPELIGIEFHGAKFLVAPRLIPITGERIYRERILI